MWLWIGIAVAVVIILVVTYLALFVPGGPRTDPAYVAPPVAATSVPIVTVPQTTTTVPQTTAPTQTTVAKQTATAPVVNWELRANKAIYLPVLTQKMLYKDTQNVAGCKTRCAADPACAGFFRTSRGSLTGGGHTIPAGTCVYFNSWRGGSAPQADSYVKI